MKRLLFATCCLLVLELSLSPRAFAQDSGDASAPDKKAGGDSDAAGDQPTDPPDDKSNDGLPPEPPKDPPPSDDALKSTAEPSAAATPTEDVPATKKRDSESWRDIVVIPRKIFLKRRRVELLPLVGTTINDNLMQHTAIGGEINYYITDILSVGVLGLYYFDTVLDQEFYTRYHFKRIPTLNKYRFTTTANMSYVPIYGKFALFNYWILQYELFVTGGVGVTGTEAIPRDANHESFSNFALTFPVGAGLRLFVNRWLAVQIGIRDFMMLDKYEKPGRTEFSGDAAKDNAESRFINNLIVNLGVSFFFPMDFKYTTFR